MSPATRKGPSTPLTSWVRGRVAFFWLLPDSFKSLLFHPPVKILALLRFIQADYSILYPAFLGHLTLSFLGPTPRPTIILGDINFHLGLTGPWRLHRQWPSSPLSFTTSARPMPRTDPALIPLTQVSHLFFHLPLSYSLYTSQKPSTPWSFYFIYQPPLAFISFVIQLIVHGLPPLHLTGKSPLYTQTAKHCWKKFTQYCSSCHH